MGLLAFAVPLTSSVVLNILLYNYAQQYYRELNQTRLDPIGLTVYPIRTNPPVKFPSNHVKVVFFGDSRAQAWSNPSDVDGFEFMNRGIGSQTTTQVLQRYNAHIDPLKPDILVVQVGINDLKTIPLFPHLKEQIIAQCQGNIQNIVRQARTQNTVVILSTIFPVGKLPIARRLFWSKEVNQAIDQVNQFIKTLADPNVIILDTKSVLANPKGVVKTDYSLDFLHLNPMGYKALNQELVVLLQDLKTEEGFKPP